MKILITGGAGYIGAVAAAEAIKAGHDVVVFDHFVSHHPNKLGDIRYIEGLNYIKKYFDIFIPNPVKNNINTYKKAKKQISNIYTILQSQQNNNI